MEHELFQSKLKSSIDTALLSEMIRSSSSGENPHRTAAIKLILERSIQERRGRTVVKANSPQSRPVPQSKRSNEGSDTTTPPAEPPTPTPTPRPVSRPPPKSQSTPSETAPNREQTPRSESAQKTTPAATQSGAGGHKKAISNVRTSDSNSSGDVRLRCTTPSCDSSFRRSKLKDGLYCANCPGQVATRCANCGLRRTTQVRKCDGCWLSFLK